MEITHSRFGGNRYVSCDRHYCSFDLSLLLFSVVLVTLNGSYGGN